MKHVPKCLWIFVLISMQWFSGYFIGKQTADRWYAKNRATVAPLTSLNTVPFVRAWVPGEMIFGPDKNGLKGACVWKDHKIVPEEGATMADCKAMVIRKWQEDSTEHYDEWYDQNGTSLEIHKALERE